MTPPSTWNAPDFAANTVQVLALRARIEALAGNSGRMRQAELGQETATVNELTAILNAETPSLASVVTAAYAPVLTDAMEEFAELAAAGPMASMVDGSGNFTPGAAGGITGAQSRGIHEGGLEIRQVIHKAVFAGAGLYARALSLTEGTITEATADQLAALWGADSSLNPAGTKVHSANYSHGMGYFARMATTLMAVKAYAAAPGCLSERDAALVSFFRAWEETQFARATHYATAGQPGATGTDYPAKVEALHLFSEGVGLVLGFRGLAHPQSGPLAGAGRRSTDAQIDAILAAYGVNRTNLGASTTGDLIEPGSTIQATATTVENTVREIFGLTQSQVEAFRTPTAG